MTNFRIKCFIFAIITFSYPAIGSETKGGLPQLDLTTYPSLIFWSIISLLIGYFLMRYLVTPNIKSILNSRESSIQNDLVKAKSSSQEADKIKQTLIKIDTNNLDIESIFKKGKTFEENSNQILDFTREVKNMDEKNKIKIVEALWQIIYSNNEADIYETNLMRRLEGLMYIDSKIMGNIKAKIKKENL